MRTITCPLLLIGLAAGLACGDETRVIQPPDLIDANEYAEVTLEAVVPDGGNAFLDSSLTGQFSPDGGGPMRRVDGFFDGETSDRPGASRRTYRIRFLATEPGTYRYAIKYERGDATATHEGTFRVRPSKIKGLLRVDSGHPWHFQRSVPGGGVEPFFWNATTTYWLLGWKDPKTIRAIVDRLASKKVNRIRVALSGRTKDGGRWFEPLVVPTQDFAFRLEPWPAARPDSVEGPGYDVKRFNLEFWRKAEAMLRDCRDRDMIVSLIYYLDGADKGVDPFGKARAGSEDERRYYRYGVARLAAFANVTWDVTNEYHLFRDEAWTNRMGSFLKEIDPYGHLTSVHGHGSFAFRTAPWVDFAMFQSWDEHGGHAFMLRNREQQTKANRPIPQVNEEFGYEDHYPTWGEARKPPARSADNRRRLAWGMVMAGGYATTGERADRGTGKSADSGGGWINGRGDATMTLLDGHAHMVEFFTAFPWFQASPRDDLADNGAWALAEPGRTYAIYLPEGKAASLSLDPGRYHARRFDPRTGAWHDLGRAEGPRWTTAPVPSDPDGADWAFLLELER